MLLAALLLAGCASQSHSMLSPQNLRCEYKTNPLGIDKESPRFDWKVISDKPDVRDQKQTAYQILVASSEENLAKDHGDLWDSSVVKSDETAQINYAGAALGSEQRACWKVRVWDGEGKVSDWTKPAMFSMGLLKPGDWKANWIGYDATIPATPPPPALTIDGLNWIWSDSQANAANPAAQYSGAHPAPGSMPIGTRYFRKVITLPVGKIVAASAVASADQRFELSINGSTVVFGQDAHRLWPVDIARYLKPGQNVLGIWAHSERPGHFGAMARFKIEVEKQAAMSIDLDPSWQVATTRIEGWDSATTVTGDWQNAEVVAKVGDAPMGMPAPRLLELPPPPYLRKEFTAGKPIARATLTASALGLYEIHLNGQRVGKDDLAPGWTEYSRRVHYQTYDVTPMVKQGANTIGAILGDGWYAGYFGFHGKRNWYGGEPRLIAQAQDRIRRRIGRDDRD